MKYWRGYLVAAIAAAFALALMAFAKAHTELIDIFYPYVTRMIQSFLTDWSSSVSFCLWQLAAAVLIVGMIASLVLMVVLRWNPVQLIGWILAVVSIVFFLHTGIYGLNYYAGPLSEDIRLTNEPYTLDELEAATAYYRDQANALSLQVARDSEGNPEFPSFETLAEQAGEGFHTLTYQEYMPVFAGSTVPVKKLGWANMYTAMGITGFTMFLTGEAAVNPQVPPVSLPFTICHEMAHRMCIAQEQDANMAAFLACRAHSEIPFRYSAYFMAYRYCYSALASHSPEAAKRVAAGAGELLRHDMGYYNDFFNSRQDDTATDLATTVNDTYIKVSGNDKGVASYGEVCDLLVNWHIQTIILPSSIVEEPDFNPMDETQIDLSGLPNAKESYANDAGNAE